MGNAAITSRYHHQWLGGSFFRARQLCKLAKAEESGPLDLRYPQIESALGTLQGMEGASAAAFFRVFGHLLKHDMGIQGGFSGRKRLRLRTRAMRY